MELYKLSEIKLEFKPRYRLPNKLTINSSNDAYQILLKTWNKAHIELLEESRLLLVDGGNNVLGVANIGLGGKSSVLVDVGIVFSIALKACASGIIFSHNHPSGRLRPSKHDIYLTDKIVAAAQILDIRVCDHIIVTTEGYFSFKDEGLI